MKSSRSESGGTDGVSSGRSTQSWTVVGVVPGGGRRVTSVLTGGAVVVMGVFCGSGVPAIVGAGTGVPATVEPGTVVGAMVVIAVGPDTNTLNATSADTGVPLTLATNHLNINGSYSTFSSSLSKIAPRPGGVVGKTRTVAFGL